MRHPDVQEAVVHGVWEHANGEMSPNQSFQSYIVKMKGSVLTAEDVHKYLAQQAPAINGLAGDVVFLDSIPRTTVSLKLLVRHESCVWDV